MCCLTHEKVLFPIRRLPGDNRGPVKEDFDPFTRRQRGNDPRVIVRDGDLRGRGQWGDGYG